MSLFSLNTAACIRLHSAVSLPLRFSTDGSLLWRRRLLFICLLDGLAFSPLIEQVFPGWCTRDVSAAVCPRWLVYRFGRSGVYIGMDTIYTCINTLLCFYVCPLRTFLFFHFGLLDETFSLVGDMWLGCVELHR